MPARPNNSTVTLFAVFLCWGTQVASAADYSNVGDGFTVALAGDVASGSPMLPIIQQKSPQLLALLRGVDLTVGNFENTAIDWHRYEGSPSAQSGGDWFIASADVPRDLKEIGFGLFGRANNHGTDWGVEGLALTNRLLEEAGLAHAGSGSSEHAARAPAFVNTQKGRVSLVAMASSYLPGSRAGDSRGLVPARPGISALQVTRTFLVSPERLASLADTRDAIARRLAKPVPPDRTVVELSGQRFSATTESGDAVDFRYEVDEADKQAVLRSVRQARRTSDLTVLSAHWHEPSNELDTPADFSIALAREAIDNGADAVLGHGPHLLRAIEIYKGRPIFYSLGNFSMMVSTMQPLPRDEFRETKMDPDTALDVEPLEYNLQRWSADPIRYDSVVPVLRYQDGEVAEIRVYPIVLGHGDRGPSKGVPRLATGEDARRILTKLQDLSRPYGTNIVAQGDVGVITLKAARGKR